MQGDFFSIFFFFFGFRSRCPLRASLDPPTNSMNSMKLLTMVEVDKSCAIRSSGISEWLAYPSSRVIGTACQSFDVVLWLQVLSGPAPLLVVPTPP